MVWGGFKYRRDIAHIFINRIFTQMWMWKEEYVISPKALCVV